MSEATYFSIGDVAAQASKQLLFTQKFIKIITTICIFLLIFDPRLTLTLSKINLAWRSIFEDN